MKIENDYMGLFIYFVLGGVGIAEDLCLGAAWCSSDLHGKVPDWSLVPKGVRRLGLCFLILDLCSPIWELCHGVV